MKEFGDLLLVRNLFTCHSQQIIAEACIGVRETVIFPLCC